jgi:hypothetical protein
MAEGEEHDSESYEVSSEGFPDSYSSLSLYGHRSQGNSDWLEQSSHMPLFGS